MVTIPLKVEISPDSGTARTPVSFTLRERTFRVREVTDRWQGADYAYFKLIADDGNLYVIKHDLETDGWELVQMEAISRP